jgi:hypothetical protein
MGALTTTSLAIAEMSEFASFEPLEQDYLIRALDIGLARRDAFVAWGIPGEECSIIRRHYDAYQALKGLRAEIPASDMSAPDPEFLSRLIAVSAFDLSQEMIESFSAYRFLYERLLGAGIRPWLPAAFCAAAALPHIRPERRKSLLHSLSEAAATAPAWSQSAPTFLPEAVELEIEGL